MRRLGLLLLAGCATAATKDSASSAKKDGIIDAGVATAEGGVSVAVADAASPPEPPSGPVTAFYPVVQGACPAATATLVGKTPILRFAKAAWGLAGDEARPMALQPAAQYSWFYGGMLGENDRLGLIGGPDEEHLWYVVGNSSGRGEDGSALVYRGKSLSTPSGTYGFYGIQNVIQQPDGSIWAFGHHSMYLDIPGDEKIPQGDDLPDWRYNRWFAWDKDGHALAINLPKGDMETAVRLDNGELVAGGVTKAANHPQLRRWSPTRKVDDFTTGETTGWLDIPEVRAGRTRAVMRVKNQPRFYSYDGADKLTLSPLSARAKGPSSWLVTRSDELWIATTDAKVFIETKDGKVSETPAPEPGLLAGETSTPWFMGNSGAVYERTDGGWRKLTLPDGPWSEPTHPPNRVEWVSVLGNETWVGTVRTDRGFGFKDPTQVRTFYSSRPRTTTLRCGSPFETSMLFPLPPRADASCKDLVVVLGRERGRDGRLAIPWTKIAAALKGNAALGDSLGLGIFGAASAYGIHAPTREIADELVKKLARVTLHEPELVCGAPDERRTATLDVKAGAFTSIPDAGAP
ncbi:MAG: hypothetical protein U0270_25700 [Labilithrix sp.]